MKTFSLNGERLQAGVYRCMRVSLYGEGCGWYRGKEVKQQG